MRSFLRSGGHFGISITRASGARGEAKNKRTLERAREFGDSDRSTNFRTILGFRLLTRFPRL